MKKMTSTRCLHGRFLVATTALLMTVAAVRADYQSTVLGDTPLAYYPLNLDVDTNGFATDLSGNGNTGTNVNVYSGFDNAAGPSDFITNAINFDGFTQYIDLGNGVADSLNFSGPITMEAWVQSGNTTQGPRNIIAKGYESSVNSELTLRANGANWFGAAYNGGTHGASGGTQTANWTHLVCTYDGVNWKLYENSVLLQSNADGTGAIAFAFPWRIGTGSGDFGNSRYFQGKISSVALYNYGLTANQVNNHYFMGKYGVSPSNAIPIITTQPQSQSTYVGGSVTFSVGVLSILPTTNQWFKSGSPLPGKTNASLILNNVQSGDDVNYSVVVGNANGITNSDSASLTLFTPAQLQWLGAGNSGQWDTSSSANWFDLSNSVQTVFNPGDQVHFNDVAGAPTNVSIPSSVAPSLITVDATSNYTFTGSGPITGTGGLVKKGSGTLTMTSGANFTGPITVGGGTVYAGNFALAGVSSITVTNNSTLDFGGADVSGSKPVFVSGTGVGNVGALINTSFETYNNVMGITLIGDSTFGGSSRWDLASGSTITGPYNLTLNRANSGVYGEWKSVNISTNVGDILLATGKLGVSGMSSSFGNSSKLLTVNNNFELDFWSGGCNRTIHVLNNGKVQIFSSPDTVSGNMIFEENAQWYLYGGSGTQNLSGNATFNGVAHFLVGDAHRAYNGVLSGTGGFVVDGWNHQMIFSASNTYSGPTIIGDGPQVALTGTGSISHSSLIFFGGNNAGSTHLDANSRPDQMLTLASGQTLGGIGQIAGRLTVGAGATLAPAGTNTTIGITTGQNSTGTVSATGDIALNGTTVIKLNGSGTNDAVTSTTGSIALGGTLSLQNINAVPLAAGDSFQIFNAGSVTGSFTGIAPMTPGAGLAWNTSQLASGIVSVVAAASQPVISSIVASGGNLIFSGTNGTAGGTYYVLTSTDVTVPLAGWTPVSTNTFGPGGVFSVTNAISLGTPKSFFLLKLP
jgi:autotransporter-associated beta strand protein